MDNTDQGKWDRRYLDSHTEPRAASVLVANRHLLPTSGMALDLACGLGGNALLLAEHGLEVEAWDISPVAVDKLRGLCGGLAVKARTLDLMTAPLPTNRFEVIVVSYFLQRSLVPAIIAALRPGGLLFYQTFNHIQLGRGPSNPDYRLQENELLKLFAGLNIRYYREDATAGDATQGVRDEALLVAQKPRSG